MKATGIVRNLDELGRYVVPKEIRKKLGIKNGDPLETFIDGDMVILRKYAPGCSCGSMKALTTINGITLCRQCIAEFVRTSRIPS